VTKRSFDELMWLASSGSTLADLGHCPGASTCNCYGCRLIRAGACLQCAARVCAEIARGKGGGQVRVSLCKGSCSEAVEQFFCR
jgi:hypothetical protein